MFAMWRKIVVPLLFLLFSVSCVPNTVYYKSSDEAVLASASKRTFSSEQKSEFSSLVVGSESISAAHRLSEFYIQFDSAAPIKVTDFSLHNKETLESFKVPSHPYIPEYLEENEVRCYEKKGLSLILSGESFELMRVSLLKTQGVDLKIGLSKDSMFSLPLSLNQLKSFFGDGEVFSVFNH